MLRRPGWKADHVQARLPSPSVPVLSETAREGLARGEGAPSLGIAGMVDVETTGLSHRYDEIVELALILFAFDRETGKILGVVEEYAGLREPSVPISAEASSVHGITWEMVRGRRLDESRIERMLRRAEFLVAHNAVFDRGFVIRLFPVAARKPWLCSMRNVNWHRFGFSSTALQNLLQYHGIVTGSAHRGAADARATLELLNCTDPDGQPYFRSLLQAFHPGRDTAEPWPGDSSTRGW